MKKKLEFLSGVILVTMLFSEIIFAMNTAELLVRYKEVNPSYKKIGVQNQINVAVLDQYDANILASKEQEDTIVNNISAAEAQYDAYEEEDNIIGMLNMQYQIENLNSQWAETRKKLATYTLQKDVAKYQTVYSDKIIDMQQRKLEYEFLKRYCLIPVQEAGIEFCETRIDQMENLISAEKVKLSLGYSTELSVNELKVQLEQAELEKELMEVQLLQSRNYVNKNTYNSAPITVSYESPALISYNVESCVDQFYEKNPNCQQFENQMDAYTDYIATLSNIPETEAERKSAQLQKDSVGLDLEQYKIDLPLYVEGKIMEYESYERQYHVKDFEISVCKEKISQLEELHKKGKVKQSDLWELEVELSKLKYEEKNIRYQMQLSQFVLEHQVE